MKYLFLNLNSTLPIEIKKVGYLFYELPLSIQEFIVDTTLEWRDNSITHKKENENG